MSVLGFNPATFAGTLANMDATLANRMAVAMKLEQAVSAFSSSWRGAAQAKASMAGLHLKETIDKTTRSADHFRETMDQLLKNYLITETSIEDSF